MRTTSETEAMAREAAADKYDLAWPHVTTYGELPRESFIAGWDAAMEYVNTVIAEGVSHLDPS